MGNTKPKAKQTQERLSSHKFDTTDYIVLDTGVHRDAATGRLVSGREQPSPHKSGK